MRIAITTATLLLTGCLAAQRLPEPSVGAKGTLVLPIPVGNKLFTDLTETIGQIDLVVQAPLWKGLGLGMGGKVAWFGLEERQFAPARVSGEIFRTTWFGKLQWERYTGPRAFVELAATAGLSSYVFRCSTCPDDARERGGHVGFRASYYLHVTDNLAFGLLLGYERDQAYLSPERFGLEQFPARSLDGPQGPFKFLNIGLGFSTRFRRGEELAW